MMREYHPYGEFIPPKPQAMIIGSFPIGKFTHPKRRHEIKEHEFDFFFGGEKNLLWKILGEVFKVKITQKEDIIRLLERKKLAVGDVIRSCRRKNNSAADADLFDIEWNLKLIDVIHEHRIKKVFFTSKKVEQWFNKLFPDADDLEKITLISPSGQSLRSLPRRPEFKAWLDRHPGEKKLRFIVDDYRKKFETIG